jgi:hypothetical protein
MEGAIADRDMPVIHRGVGVSEAAQGSLVARLDRLALDHEVERLLFHRDYAGGVARPDIASAAGSGSAIPSSFHARELVDLHEHAAFGS